MPCLHTGPSYGDSSNCCKQPKKVWETNFVTSLKYFTAPYKVFLIQISHSIFSPKFKLSTDLCLIFICQLWIRSISSNTHCQQPMYNNVRVPTISYQWIKKVSKANQFLMSSFCHSFCNHKDRIWHLHIKNVCSIGLPSNWRSKMCIDLRSQTVVDVFRGR